MRMKWILIFVQCNSSVSFVIIWRGRGCDGSFYPPLHIHACWQRYFTMRGGGGPGVFSGRGGWGIPPEGVLQT